MDLARRFHPDTRNWVIKQSSRDDSGRLRELARVCPGTLLLAFEAERRGPPFDGIARDMLAGVVKGTRLERLLLGAVETQLLLLRPEPTEADVCLGASPASRALPPGGRPWSAPDPIRMRLIIRRASARVDPRDLWGPPPPAFSPEDIPCGRRNAPWYATMRMLTDLARGDGRELPPCAWSFFSRRAADLADVAAAIAAPGGGNRVTRTVAISEGRTLARAALDFFTETGAWPHRDSDLWRTVDRLLTWWDGRNSASFLRFSAPLPDIEDVALSPVTTGAELRDAANRLGNCLAAYSDVLVGGRRWVFTGTLLGAEVAVDVRFSCGRYVASQVAGPRNAPVSAEQRSALRRWLARLNHPMPIASRPLASLGDAQLTLGW